MPTEQVFRYDTSHITHGEQMATALRTESSGEFEQAAVSFLQDFARGSKAYGWRSSPEIGYWADKQKKERGCFLNLFETMELITSLKDTEVRGKLKEATGDEFSEDLENRFYLAIAQRSFSPIKGQEYTGNIKKGEVFTQFFSRFSEINDPNFFENEDKVKIALLALMAMDELAVKLEDYVDTLDEQVFDTPPYKFKSLLTKYEGVPTGSKLSERYPLIALTKIAIGARTPEDRINHLKIRLTDNMSTEDKELNEGVLYWLEKYHERFTDPNGPFYKSLGAVSKGLIKRIQEKTHIELGITEEQHDLLKKLVETV